jgi:hypothetical protein
MTGSYFAMISGETIAAVAIVSFKFSKGLAPSTALRAGSRAGASSASECGSRFCRALDASIDQEIASERLILILDMSAVFVRREKIQKTFL